MGKTFKPHSKEENADALAQYLPNGRIFARKFDDTSTLRRFILGLAVEMARTEGLIDLIYDEYDITKTTLLIEEWERFLGIPDDCFKRVDIPIEERRVQVLAKFARMNVGTKDDFLALAELILPGVPIDIRSGASGALFPLVFPIIFFDSPKQARFTLVVTLPEGFAAQVFDFTAQGFPILFGDDSGLVLECLFKKLAPANVFVIFKFAQAPQTGALLKEDGGFLLKEDGGKLLL